MDVELGLAVRCGLRLSESTNLGPRLCTAGLPLKLYGSGLNYLRPERLVYSG